MTDYGVDTYCADSLKTGRLARGVELVAQNAMHRLITPRGMLRGGDEEADYGFDISGKLGSTTTPDEVAALPAQIRAELKKDQRIDEVITTVREVTTGPAVSLELTIECYTGEGPFTLVANVAGVTIAMVGGGSS
jgi:hypothetical protein